MAANIMKIRNMIRQETIALRRNGFTVLRFWNNEVFENIEGVLEEQKTLP